MNERKCPSCLADIRVIDGLIAEHDNWGQGGAYAVRCSASSHSYAPMVLWRQSWDDDFEAAA